MFAEIPELAEHGITLPPNMQGLTDDQIVDLKLHDEWEDSCIPSGGAEFKKDEIGRRNGHGEADYITIWTDSSLFFFCIPLYPVVLTNFTFSAPNGKMKEVLMKTVEEAKALISKVSLSWTK